METKDVPQRIHIECDHFLAQCEFEFVREEAKTPFAASVYYRGSRLTEFEIQIFTENDIITRSLDFGIMILNNKAGTITFPQSIVDSVFDVKRDVRDAGLESVRIIYEVYGCSFFSRETLVDARIPWFKAPPSTFI